MNRRSNFDEVLLYDPQRIYSLNTNVRRSPLYAKYIWTHNLHSIHRVSKPTTQLNSPSNDKPKLTKNRQTRSNLEIPTESTSIVKITPSLINTEKSNENHALESSTFEEKGKPKALKRKELSLTETLSSHFDNVNKLVSLKRSDSEIDNRVNELVKEARSKRLLNVQKFEETQRLLFDPEHVLSETTRKSNQDFLNLIISVHKEVSPDSHQFINTAITLQSPPRNANKKLTKVSFNEEKSISKGKIAEFRLKEQETVKRAKIIGKRNNRIPFTVMFM